MPPGFPPYSPPAPLPPWHLRPWCAQLAELLKPGMQVTARGHFFGIASSIDFRDYHNLNGDRWESRRILLNHGYWFEFSYISAMGGIWQYIPSHAGIPDGAWPGDTMSLTINGEERILLASGKGAYDKYVLPNGVSGQHCIRWYGDGAVNEYVGLIERFDDGPWLGAMAEVIHAEDISII